VHVHRVLSSHAFFWTLDYAPPNAAINRDGNGNPISDAFSLAQVQYVNGQIQTRYTKAYPTIKDYIARYPQWITQPTPTPVPTPKPPTPMPTTGTTLHYKLPQIIRNSGTNLLTWSASSDQPWCFLDITSGIIEPGNTQIFHVIVDVSVITEDVEANVTVESNGGNFVIPINMRGRGE
jgi:hypothetical protein